VLKLFGRREEKLVDECGQIRDPHVNVYLCQIRTILALFIGSTALSIMVRTYWENNFSTLPREIQNKYFYSDA
jgi:hypothetical protein